MKTFVENAELPLLSDGPLQAASSELVQNLLRMWQIARHRRNTLIRAVCVSAIIGAGYYALAPRFYDSTAKLLIVQRNQDQVANMAEQPALETTITTHREIIISPVVISRAVEQLLPEHRIDFQHAEPSEWGRLLASRLSARTTRKANFIHVKYRSRSPEAAAAVVSAVIQSYLQFVDQTHKGSSSEAITLLSQKSEQVAAALAVKKQELQACRDQVGSLSMKADAGMVEPTIQRVLKLNEALMAAQQRRLKLEASRDAITAGIKSGADLQQHIFALEEVVGRQMLISALGLTPQDLMLMKSQEQKLLDARTELQRAARYYGAAHPKVIALQERVHSIEQYLQAYHTQTSERLAGFGNGQLPVLLEKLIQQTLVQAELEERRLQLAFDEERDKARAQTGDMQKMLDTEREVARLEAEYDSLVSKIATVDIHQLQAPIQATVVEEPLPDDVADSPQIRLVALLSLVGGLLIGGAIAYVQDVLDDRFSSPEEMAAQLAVPMLSMVRQLTPLEGSGLASVHTYVTPNAVETETFRTLRTALTLAQCTTERIAISSAEPGDGKTTIAANLAVSFAQAGKKTLLIDVDLRKPGLTALLGLKGQLGVADVLYGCEAPAIAAARLVRQTELTGLDVLPAGLRRPDPAELLSSQNFVELLAWAEANYDQLVVDCPPVLAVSDAQIIGRLLDGVILVVQPHKNHRRLVARAVQCFTATGTTVLGIVANGLSAEASRGYGYGYGYGYGEETSAQDAVPRILSWKISRESKAA